MHFNHTENPLGARSAQIRSWHGMVLKQIRSWHAAAFKAPYIAMSSPVFAEKREQALRQPIEIAGKRAGGEAYVAAFLGLLEQHRR
jgi:hypothetical protein